MEELELAEWEYRDEGCDLSPSCLNCPLPRCIYERPRGKQKMRLEARAKRMAELRRGKSLKEVAEVFGVSLRTVQRVLRGKDD